VRIGVYGGSFNPPHVGHAMVAAWLKWTDQVDEVWLVPTWQHAFGKELAPFHLRVAMCEALAAQVGAFVRVSTVEQDLGGVSYTIDTLRHLSDAQPTARFRLVVGADNLAVAPKWRAWDAIVRDFAPIVVGRSGVGAIDGAPSFPEVSSTGVREAIASGRDVAAWVPSEVLRVVVAERLYTTTPDGGGGASGV
jgi:nicotinate-nucleotide adenylyltransferase